MAMAAAAQVMKRESFVTVLKTDSKNGERRWRSASKAEKEKQARSPAEVLQSMNPSFGLQRCAHSC